MRYQFSFLTAFFLIITNGLKAQLNVGSTAAPDASAVLQVTASNKGLRLPQVSLSTTTAFGLSGTSSSATNGMLVWNTNTSITGNSTYPAQGAGTYTWDGTGWAYAGSLNPVIYAAGTGTFSGNIASNAASGNLNMPAGMIMYSPLGNSGTTITGIPAGNYKIDVTVIAKAGANGGTAGYFIGRIYLDGVEVTACAAAYAPNSLSLGTFYAIPTSYVGAIGAGQIISIRGQNVNSGINVQFKIASIVIQRLD